MYFERHFYEVKNFKTFDISIFSSCLLITFLLCKKISTNICNLTSNLTNKIDLYFVIICFTILCIPIFNISNETKSITENRNLAIHPNLTTETGLNLKFGEQFNSWLSDHFYLRDKLINAAKNINKSNRYYLADDAYFDREEELFIYIPQLYGTYFAPEKSTLKKIKNNVKKLANQLSETNTKLYIVFAPQKSSIYADKLKLFRFLNKNTVANLLKKELDNISNLKVLYPLKEFKELSLQHIDYTHFYSDTHMTDFGTWVLYSDLMNIIQKDFPRTKITQLNEFKYEENKFVRSMANSDYFLGDMNQRTVNSEKYLTKTYKHYDVSKMLNKVKVIDDTEGASEKIYYHKNGSPYKAILMGSSYVNKFNSFFNFDQVYTLQLNKFLDENRDLSDFHNIISDFHPNIFVIIINEGNAVKYLKKLYH